MVVPLLAITRGILRSDDDSCGVLAGNRIMLLADEGDLARKNKKMRRFRLIKWILRVWGTIPGENRGNEQSVWRDACQDLRTTKMILQTGAQLSLWFLFLSPFSSAGCCPLSE